MSNKKTQQLHESYWPILYQTIPGGYQGSIKAYKSIDRAITHPAIVSGTPSEEYFTSTDGMIQRPVGDFGSMVNYDPAQYMTVTPGYWRSQGKYMIDF
jgi:hypothetical protein